MNTILIPESVMAQINTHGENSYPDEGAGFLLGTDSNPRVINSIYLLPNARESSARHNRYLITARDYLRGELEADRLGLILLGVFHSHPDHPDRPSEFDREWAQPWFSYVITSVQMGKALESRSWRLRDDRTIFDEEMILNKELTRNGNTSITKS